MYADQNTAEVIRSLKSSRETGLSKETARDRLEQYGLNQLEEQKKKGTVALFMEQLCDPLIYILMAAIAISLFLGEVGDAAIIAAVILLNSIVGVVQEDKARKAIEALKQLSSPRASCAAGGKRGRNPGNASGAGGYCFSGGGQTGAGRSAAA